MPQFPSRSASVPEARIRRRPTLWSHFPIFSPRRDSEKKSEDEASQRHKNKIKAACGKVLPARATNEQCIAHCEIKQSPDGVCGRFAVQYIHPVMKPANFRKPFLLPVLWPYRLPSGYREDSSEHEKALKGAK